MVTVRGAQVVKGGVLSKLLQWKKRINTWLDSGHSWGEELFGDAEVQLSWSRRSLQSGRSCVFPLLHH